MIITTTPRIEDKTIKQYHGIVFGEVITGVNMFKDVAAGFRDIFGGRSSSYEGELQQAREKALKEMQEHASALGANAVIGVDIDYEVIGSMLMVSTSGTAVTVE